ncbi:MAG: ketopantoate reductase family protein [Candidatus Promineofilum sp.]|nr:ketopantoate reductase family protein [Promineifilum sp.]
MEILVYGAGAVGGYLGGKLALAGRRVTLVMRPDTAAVINRDGLYITESNGTCRAPVRAVGELAAAFAATAGYDLIIVGMKAYDLEDALAQLGPFCPKPARVMTTQNGIGVEELVAGRVGAERTLVGSVTIPISRGDPGHLVVERSGRGLGIAPVWPNQVTDEWVALFRAAEINAGACSDYRAMKWSKAFLNIMGNATSAILNRPPAELYRLRPVFDLEMRMLREMLAVMKRLGIEVINLPGATARPLARALTYAPRALLPLVFTQVIVRGRGNKMPSFHIDLAAGKRRSEIAFHNGAIATAGKQAGVPVPVNAALNDTLQGLCRDQSRRSWFDGRPDRLLAVVRDYEQGKENV